MKVNRPFLPLCQLRCYKVAWETRSIAHKSIGNGDRGDKIIHLIGIPSKGLLKFDRKY